MNLISTKAHGIMDYVMGLFLVACPWIFNLDIHSAEGMVPMAIGGVSILYSLITNYELGAVKGISMRAHLWMDELAGFFLAISPWLFNFDERVYLPHLILGIAEFGLAFMTQTQSYTARHHHRRSVASVHHAH